MIDATRQRLLSHLSTVQDEISALLIWPGRDEDAAGVKVQLSLLRTRRARIECALERLPPIPPIPTQVLTWAGDSTEAYPGS